MSIEMTPAAVPPMTAPVLIESTAGGATVGVPALSRIWLEFTGVMCNKNMMSTQNKTKQNKTKRNETK